MQSEWMRMLLSQKGLNVWRKARSGDEMNPNAESGKAQR